MTPQAPQPTDARAGAWAATAAGLAGVLVAGSALASAGARGIVLMLAVAGYAGVMAPVVWLLPHHHPHVRFGPANAVTVVRVALTVLAAATLVEPPSPRLAWWIIAITTVATGLDGVDGWLARRTRLQSAFGARFDMEVDALLVLVVSSLVWRYDKAGAWVLLCGAMRYLFLAGRLAWPWLGRPLTPTWRGKTVAVLQCLGLAIALAPTVPGSASRPIAALTLAALAASFAIDVRRLWLAAGSESLGMP